MVDGDDDDDDDAPKLPGVILFLLLWGTFYPYKWFSILCIFSFIKWQHHKHSAVHIPQSYAVCACRGGGGPGIHLTTTSPTKRPRREIIKINSALLRRSLRKDIHSSAILVSSATKRPGFYEYVNSCSFVVECV